MMETQSPLWTKRTFDEIKQRVFAALQETADFRTRPILGLPASRLDDRVFYDGATFLRDAPYMSTLVHNPNNIGCHTLGDSERHFRGTQKLELEVIRICAEEIFLGQPHAHDGYVTSGGTEANIEAAWIYRNYFQREFAAEPGQIAVIASSDAHYSIAKACNLLGLRHVFVPVDDNTREMDESDVRETVRRARADGVRYWIAVVNMGTTMFGSVDPVKTFTQTFREAGDPFKLHVDAAFGGFVYPFTGDASAYGFANPMVDSIALDAHKMVQAPYGTGVFLIRKGLIPYVCTREAKYVSGMDVTLIGSRSGANAVAIWMILMTYGRHGWREKIHTLIDRTNWLCERLQAAGRGFYRHPRMNIVALRAAEVSDDVAGQFTLVPDVHDAPPAWYKIVVMDHVSIDRLEQFVGRLG